ncbi:probable serine hydrolase [Neocloeon triangulifer]|uniref:probable serine hydrolase n=1 Tax=Neocloeon triangulifer TaxID=2078957 RepID=UPI00286EB52B|nr:probable serine hydrolase [Neocloeon triangulifer]
MRNLVNILVRRGYSSAAPKFEEIKIPVPWGHIAAKWWGPQDKQPVLALHGWQENCNAYDPLMKILPADLSVLAFDMPGYGHSSRFSSHGISHVLEEVTALRALNKHFAFKDPIKFLLHSYSISTGLIYAANYPKDVERMLAIDFIKPLAVDGKFLANAGGQMLDRLVDIEMKIEKGRETTLEKHAEMYSKAVMNSLSVEKSKLLMERGTALNPETGLFYLIRDPRHKINFYFSFPNEVFVEMAKNLRCKILYIHAKKGTIFEHPKVIKAVQVEIEKATDVEYGEVDGTHHVHMENPELVKPFVLDFLFGRKC